MVTQNSVTQTPDIESIYIQEHAKAMSFIGNAEITLKVFLFALILACINLVAFI